MRWGDPMARALRPAGTGLRDRVLEAEWLDELPARDPRAVRSRRDLERVNALMGNILAMRRLLEAHCREPARSILDIGAGDGTLSLRLARRLSRRWHGVHVTLLDRQAVVSEATRAAFRTLGWSVDCATADVLDYLGRAPRQSADVIIANLFLHHLETEKLARLFTYAAERTTLLVACEPRRSAAALSASRLLWAIGCNDVSRHDAVASVRAGFRGHELSSLWPASLRWALEERPAGPLTHTFVARRVAPESAECAAMRW